MADDSGSGFFARMRGRLFGGPETDAAAPTEDTGVTQAGGDDPGPLVETGGVVQDDPAGDEPSTIGDPPPEWAPSADAGSTATAAGVNVDPDQFGAFTDAPPPGPAIPTTDANLFATSFEQAPPGNALPDPTLPEPEAPLTEPDPPIDLGPEDELPV